MSGYNQNCIISPMPQVSAATAAHSGPYTIKSSDSYQGALVVISGLAAETVAVQRRPRGGPDPHRRPERGESSARPVPG